MMKQIAKSYPLTNDIDSSLKEVSGRAEWAVVGLRRENDRTLGTWNEGRVRPTERNAAGAKPGQLYLRMTAVVAEFLHMLMIAGIGADYDNSSFVGQ